MSNERLREMSNEYRVILLCQNRMPFVLSLSKDERTRPSGSRFDRLSTNGNAGIHESDTVGVGSGQWAVNGWPLPVAYGLLCCGAGVSPAVLS